MRVLLDENMPLDFGDLLVGHDVEHLELIGLKGTKNGAMIDVARRAFDALVTLDRGILFQHNHKGSNLIVVIVRTIDSKVETINARAPEVVSALAQASPGDLIELHLNPSEGQSDESV